MAHCQEGQNLSGGGVAPPLLLRTYTGRVEVEDALVADDALAPGQHAACHVLDVSHRSPVGNPFAPEWANPESVVCAYEDLLSMTLWLGRHGCTARVDDLPGLIARRHGLRLAARATPFSVAAAWEYLSSLAVVDGAIRVVGCDNSSAQSDRLGRRAADCAYGAVAWLRDRREAAQPVHAGVTLKAGRWPVWDIFARWPREVAVELAAFTWPLTSVQEVTALLASSCASPRALMAFEFTGAVRDAYSKHWKHQRVALSVDLRGTLVPGPHAMIDVREVIMLTRWEEAYLHPPCTHQVLSDARAAKSKMLDGRAFWGISLFIYSWCVRAARIMLEQPPTIIPDYYLSPTQVVRPCELGDSDGKRFHLYERGGRLPLTRNREAQGTSGHKRLRDFSDAEARDRWRSSWARFPRMCEAVVAAVDEGAMAAEDLVYSVEIERFACSWHDAGLPVPPGYAAEDAQPPDPESRRYQSVRGRGDGRRIQGVIPASRVGGCLAFGPPISGTPTTCMHRSMVEGCSRAPCHPTCSGQSTARQMAHKSRAGAHTLAPMGSSPDQAA